MRLAVEIAFSAKAFEGGKLPPSPRVRAATATRLKACRAAHMGFYIPRGSGRNTPPLNFGVFGDFVNCEVWEGMLDPQLLCPYISRRWSRRLYDTSGGGDQFSSYRE